MGRNSGCRSGLGPSKSDLCLAGWRCGFAPGGMLDPWCRLVHCALVGPVAGQRTGERRGGQAGPV
jgi:hypothetical protein